VVSVTFQLLYVFVILDIGTRRVVHWNLTEHPTVEWTMRQFRQGLLPDGASRFLVNQSRFEFLRSTGAMIGL